MKTLSDALNPMISGSELMSEPPSEYGRFSRTLHMADPEAFARMSTRQVRQSFLVDELFEPGELTLIGSDLDRAIIGSAVPQNRQLSLGQYSELASGYFTERREAGVINIGPPGAVTVGGTAYSLDTRDTLYIGRGNPDIAFDSIDHTRPAMFYLVSYPAHATYPTRRIPREEAQSGKLGNRTAANERTIVKCIQPPFVQSCQLIMGFTEIAEGSVWNTMPAHLHPRRSEVYLYFSVPPESVVLHCMGKPDETRHIVVRDRQAVFSPSWSIHSGVGTTNYSFVWAMGGENQDFSDMEPVPMAGLA